jgi:hypothetical protein
LNLRLLLAHNSSGETKASLPKEAFRNRRILRNVALSQLIEEKSHGCSDEGDEDDRAKTQTGPGPRRRRAEYEVAYEAKKTGRSAAAVKKAVKKVGNSRKRIEKRLGR